MLELKLRFLSQSILTVLLDAAESAIPAVLFLSVLSSLVQMQMVQLLVPQALEVPVEHQVSWEGPVAVLAVLGDSVHLCPYFRQKALA